MLDLDRTITAWLNAPAGHNAMFDQVMIAITTAGVYVLVAAVALQWFIKPNQPARRYAIIATGLAFVLGQAINQVILLGIHRIRPYDTGLTHLIVEKSADWSFPSDHATAAASIAATFAILAWRKQKICFALAAIIICWSRVYVGTHYISDVIAGSLTAIAAALIVTRIYKSSSRINQMLIGIL
jgi:undecaprenyl-diphosphatase